MEENVNEGAALQIAQAMSITDGIAAKYARALWSKRLQTQSTEFYLRSSGMHAGSSQKSEDEAAIDGIMKRRSADITHNVEQMETARETADNPSLAAQAMRLNQEAADKAIAQQHMLYDRTFSTRTTRSGTSRRKYGTAGTTHHDPPFGDLRLVMRKCFAKCKVGYPAKKECQCQIDAILRGEKTSTCRQWQPETVQRYERAATSKRRIRIQRNWGYDSLVGYAVLTEVKPSEKARICINNKLASTLGYSNKQDYIDHELQGNAEANVCVLKFMLVQAGKPGLV